MAAVRTRATRRGGDPSRVPFGTRARTILAASLLPVAIVAGCAGDDDETLPAIDQSSSPDVDDPSESAGRPSRTDRSGGSIPASAPEGAELAPDEQAAYDKAVTDHADWVKTALRMRADPMANPAVDRLVRQWAAEPYASQFIDELHQFAANDVEVHGRTEVHWRVPVRVNLDARWPVMTWKECDGDGTVQVTKGGEPVDQSDSTPYASMLTLRADSTGRWRPTISKDLGPCDA